MLQWVCLWHRIELTHELLSFRRMEFFAHRRTTRSEDLENPVHEAFHLIDIELAITVSIELFELHHGTTTYLGPLLDQIDLVVFRAILMLFNRFFFVLVRGGLDLKIGMWNRVNRTWDIKR